MLERFIDKTTFESQEDFIKNFKIMESILILRLPT